MSDKERLIELLHKAEDICDSTLDCDTCKYVGSGSCKTVLIADYLLANGVIVPPAEVGQTVYCVDDFLKIVEKCKVYGFSVVNGKKQVFVDNGECKFVTSNWNSTKEEAEAKLKELGK